MSAIATSYWSHLSHGTIAFWVLCELAVLIGAGCSRSKWMGFVVGGMAGLVFAGWTFIDGGGPLIFAYFFDSSAILFFAIWFPLISLVNANLGMIAAMIGNYVAIKSGKKPRDRF